MENSYSTWVLIGFSLSVQLATQLAKRYSNPQQKKALGIAGVITPLCLLALMLGAGNAISPLIAGLILGLSVSPPVINKVLQLGNTWQFFKAPLQTAPLSQSTSHSNIQFRH